MPTNGNDALCVATLRGVRRASPKDFSAHATTILPDVVTALSDTPFTNPPYSQKRLTKSIERSALWLASLLSGTDICHAWLAASDTNPTALRHLHPPRGPDLHTRPERLRVLPPRTPRHVPKLSEHLDIRLLAWKDGERVKTLDDGVSGYTVDLAPIVQNLEIRAAKAGGASTVTNASAAMTGAGSRVGEVVPLLEASLGPLPDKKPRLVNGVPGAA
ncbi:hypothetical protein FA13DRAFT_1794057 [Coprinellus micaceus]|uniref:Uncharacterized protein n=1 Tax=Coprinellus micaceus TaxID=71717 RepID=A0A4Y7T2C5_COPMI|nr:hypothetical protein FA13DRAFT_1794057 [Coprinellus micaceus]